MDNSPPPVDWRCGVIAWGTAAYSLDELKPLRRELQSALSVPASLLKQANDQTLVALAAVHRAIQRTQKSTTDFSEWGVLATARFLARQKLAQTLSVYESEGALAISPHLVAHHLPHSVSACISVALGCKGMNWGFGGGTNLEELVLALPGVFADEALHGLWLVASTWVPEESPALPEPEKERQECRSVALALVSPNSEKLAGVSAGSEVVPGTLRVRLVAKRDSDSQEDVRLTAKNLFEPLDRYGDADSFPETQWNLVQGGTLYLQPTTHP